MRPLIEFAKNQGRKLARWFGYDIRNIEHSPYGINVWSDVARLSTMLDYPIHLAFDVGANFGQTTNEMLRAFPGAQVYAFEPDPEIFKTLVNNTEDPRAHPVQLALSDQAGVLPFFRFADNTRIGSLIKDAGYAKAKHLTPTPIEVESATIDQFCIDRGIQRINLLKVDVEGNELAVFQGARAMLERGCIDMVYFEFNDCETPASVQGGALTEICDFLHGFGFHFIATYTDYVELDESLFVVANILMVRWPKAN